VSIGSQKKNELIARSRDYFGAMHAVRRWPAPVPLEGKTAAAPPETASAGDSTLLEGLRSGDEAAFVGLYQRHARYVAGVIYRLVGDDADLDDVVQETFLDAAEGLKNVESHEAIRRWLVIVAIRRVKRLLGRRRRRSFFSSLFAATAPQVSDPGVREPIADLYEALGQLAPDLRVAWVLCRVEDQPLPEVARLCDVSLATVKRRIALAEERLKRRLLP